MRNGLLVSAAKTKLLQNHYLLHCISWCSSP